MNHEANDSRYAVHTITVDGKSFTGTSGELQLLTGLSRYQIRRLYLLEHKSRTRWPAEHREAAQRYALPELHKFLTMRWAA